MIYKCRNCAAALKFDVSIGKLKCEYCDSVFDVKEYEDELPRDKTPYETMEQKIYACSSCGAQLMINDVESATFCAYCGQPTIVFDRVSSVRKPDVILPFRITKEDAYSRIRSRLNRGLFIPKEIKEIKLDVVRGIYIPFSFSDIAFEGSYLLSGKVKSGKNTVRKHFYRRGRGHFTSVPIDESIKFNDESAARLEPFPRGDFKPFETAYLSGFYADCGDESKSDIESKASFRATKLFQEKIKKTVKASSVKIEKCADQAKIESVKYGMLPVWFFATRTKNGSCTIMVNGYTGKVIGAVPVNKSLVTAFSLALGIPLSLIIGTISGYIFQFLLYEEDSDSDFFGLVIAAIVGLFGLALAKLDAFRKSRKLTMASDIFELAQKRQEV